MRKFLILLTAVMMALTAGQAVAADQPVVKVVPFIAEQGTLRAASITAEAIGANRLTATVTPYISAQGDLWATVNFNFATMDVQSQWNAEGWPAFVDGVEVFVLATAVLPSATPVYNAIPDSSGNTVWSLAQYWTGAWTSAPGVYRPYITVQSQIAGLGGSRNVLLASSQVISLLPDSPMDSAGNVNYNYTVYIMFDPIDLQFNFLPDGMLTLGADGSFKFQGLMFFGRKLNGQLQLYTGS